MFHVMIGDTVYTAVAVVGCQWIDGNTGRAVTHGFYLGYHVKTVYREGRPYFYYEDGGHIYQLSPDGEYAWFCNAAVVNDLLP